VGKKPPPSAEGDVRVVTEQPLISVDGGGGGGDEDDEEDDSEMLSQVGDVPRPLFFIHQSSILLCHE